MTANHTIPERLVMLAAALVSVAAAAFVTARVVPVYRLLTHVEAVSALGLLLSAALLSLGVVLIVDWRRKRRALDPAELRVAADSYIGGLVLEFERHKSARDMYEEAKSGLFAGLSEMLAETTDPVDPTAELRRHLTDALAVMLRHPQLTVDAGTLRLLARRPKPVRGPDGRWKKA